MERQSKIFVAGDRTLIGGAILRVLRRQHFENILGADGSGPDLLDAGDVEDFFERTRPEYVFLAAGKSAGIAGNQKYPADLIRENLFIECHVIHSAYVHGVKKLLYLASSCCYPRHCPQPMKVESLLTGPLEPTNEAYAIARIAGIKLCEAYRRQYGVPFIAGIPADAFGPGAHFSLEDSHVVAALIRKMHEAKVNRIDTVEIWGTGNPRREFVFADDLADACTFVMQHYEGAETLNLGGGSDMSIRELAMAVQEVTGYTGTLSYDTSRPDGMPFKALDASVLLGIGWLPKTPFRAALQQTYQWFLQSQSELQPSKV